VRADGSTTVTCSGAYGNDTGLYVRSYNAVGSVPKLTLKGFVIYGNITAEDILATSIVRTACPTP